MKDTIKTILISVVVAIIVVFVVKSFVVQPTGQAPSGVTASLATSTVATVGPDEALTVFPIRKNCSSRIITTVGEPIRLSFGEIGDYTVASTTLSGTLGHTQSASTTVVYDSGTYGCGRWSILGIDASSTIVVSEFR